MDLHSARSTVRDFGLRVRAHRLSAGMSQLELARRSRVTTKFIGQIERGTSNPSLVTMVLVADALRCSLTDLLQSDVAVPRPNKTPAYISLRADDVWRVQHAAAVIASVLVLPRKGARRAR